jgi:NAD(P)-dependent dehydrogenase (short-subunit alcohol dehydrogenase family)
MGRLNDKVAVITGGTQGVGEGIAVRFLQEGARVIVTGRTESKGTRVLQRFEAIAPGRARFIRADCSDKTRAPYLVDEALKSYGRLDIVVNNAQTITPWKRVEDSAIDTSLAQELAAGVYASLWLSQAAFPIMRDQREGVILNLGSGSSINGLRFSFSYNTNKEAMHGLTRTLANEWGKFNIRVNTIMPAGRSPGFEELARSAAEVASRDEEFRQQQKLAALTSRYQPFALGEPEQIGSAAVGLSSDSGRFITGQTIFVDGGLHLWGLNHLMNVPGQRYQSAS